MKQEERPCMSCGRVLFGRTDKKFCSDGCRNTWNNKAGHRLAREVRLVNSILNRNRNLLQHTIPQGMRTTRIRKINLEAQGFNAGFFTSACKRKNGTIFFFCYEFGYAELNKDWYYIIKRKELL